MKKVTQCVGKKFSHPEELGETYKKGSGGLDVKKYHRKKGGVPYKTLPEKEKGTSRYGKVIEEKKISEGREYLKDYFNINTAEGSGQKEIGTEANGKEARNSHHAGFGIKGEGSGDFWWNKGH